MNIFQAGENGRELQKGEKYDWKQEDDTYTLIINNPVLEDDGEIYIHIFSKYIYIYNKKTKKTKRRR